MTLETSPDAINIPQSRIKIPSELFIEDIFPSRRRVPKLRCARNLQLLVVPKLRGICRDLYIETKPNHPKPSARLVPHEVTSHISGSFLPVRSYWVVPHSLRSRFIIKINWHLGFWLDRYIMIYQGGYQLMTVGDSLLTELPFFGFLVHGTGCRWRSCIPEIKMAPWRRI